MTQADVKSIRVRTHIYNKHSEKNPPSDLVTLKNFCRNENYNKILPTKITLSTTLKAADTACNATTVLELTIRSLLVGEHKNRTM